MPLKISLGKINKEHIYILLTIIFKVINSFFYGLNNNEAFKTFKIFKDNNLDSHILIRYFFNYIFILIGGLCLYLYDYYKIKKGQAYNNINEENDNMNKKISLLFILICFIWFIEELCLDYFIVSFKNVDFWMFELIILAILTKILFNTQIYKHQWFAIYISLIPVALKIISIIITLNDTCNNKTNYCQNGIKTNYEMGLPILYTINELYLLGFFLYIVFISLRAYVNIELNHLMKKKYISPKKILIWHGITGVFFSLIFIFIFSFISCNKYTINHNDSDNRGYNYSTYVCKITTNETNNNSYNITEYLEKIDKNFFTFYIIKDEICTIILGSITFLLFQYFALLVIKNLSPAHFIFSIPTIFLLQNLTNLINEIVLKICDNTIFNNDIDFVKGIKFILDFIGNIIAILGFLI